MQGWQTTYWGMRKLPREISAFELQTFFTFSPAERKLIEARRVKALKLGLALHIGFLRMSGRLLNTFRVVPPSLWRHLGAQFGVAAPEIASLRAVYGRDRTLFDYQQIACEAIGFRWMVYAEILAHGTNLTAAECARIMPNCRPPVSVRLCAGLGTSDGWAKPAKRCRSSCSATPSPPLGAGLISLPRT